MHINVRGKPTERKKSGYTLKLDYLSGLGYHLIVSFHGQRPIIIVPIDSHCNLPQNKTHSYASHLIVEPNTFSRLENGPGRIQVRPKIGCKPAFEDGIFRCLGTPQNRSTTKKLIIQKSPHPQIGRCMTKLQLIKSHNI